MRMLENVKQVTIGAGAGVAGTVSETAGVAATGAATTAGEVVPGVPGAGLLPQPAMSHSPLARTAFR